MTRSFDPGWEAEHALREWGAAPDFAVKFFIEKDYGKFDPWSRTALDVGCGVGAQTFYLAEKGFRAVGVDAAPSAIRRAKAKAHGYIDFLVADAVQLPFASNSFDLVVDMCCLQELPLEVAQVAEREMLRVVKRDGWLFSCHAMEYKKIGGQMWAHGGAPLTRMIEPKDVAALYAGFKGCAQIQPYLTPRGDDFLSIIVRARPSC